MLRVHLPVENNGSAFVLDFIVQDELFAKGTAVRRIKSQRGKLDTPEARKEELQCFFSLIGYMFANPKIKLRGLVFNPDTSFWSKESQKLADVVINYFGFKKRGKSFVLNTEQINEILSRKDHIWKK